MTMTLKTAQVLISSPDGGSAQTLEQVHQQVIGCRRCPRLLKHCRTVAAVKKAAYRDWNYWSKPVPGFGDPDARLWIIGLAPAAHGANRTGRMFTGDRSGDFLYAALHRAGFASQPASLSRDDGLLLTDCYISAAARCAPPGNKPTAQELNRCAGFLDREWELLAHKRVILALGKIAWDAAIAMARRRTAVRGSGFAHGAVVPLAPRLVLLGSYHVSQQNTFTRRLTTAMFDRVMRDCRRMMSET